MCDEIKAKIRAFAVSDVQKAAVKRFKQGE
jgi:hypothetical protein